MIRFCCSSKTASRRVNGGGTPSAPSRRRFSWLSTFTAWRANMAKKKLSASSRPARLKRVSAEDILNKPLSKRDKADLARIAKRQAAADDSQIDYSDIPALTKEQLANAKRVPKVLVAA